MFLVLCSWEIFNGESPNSAVNFHYAFPENLIHTHPVERRLLEILRGGGGVTKPKKN